MERQDHLHPEGKRHEEEMNLLSIEFNELQKSNIFSFRKRFSKSFHPR